MYVTINYILFQQVEDTPVCFSRNSSLSSIDFSSEDGNNLLSACISSAIPPEKQQNYPVPVSFYIIIPQPESLLKKDRDILKLKGIFCYPLLIYIESPDLI